MNSRVWFAAWLSVVSCGVVLASDNPASDRVVRLDLAADHFMAGASVRLDTPVTGDLLAAGGEVEVNAAVGGDAAIAGGKLRLTGDIAKDAYVAGGQLDLAGTVGGNARIAGGQVETNRDFRILGNASVTGGDLKLRGNVGGYLQVAGGRLMLDGVVDGDVIANAGELTLGPNARIAGKLRYASRHAPKQDPAAQVAGGLERMPMPTRLTRFDDDDRRMMARGVGLLWTLGVMLLAAVLVAGLPGLSASIARVARTRAGFSLLLGFILLVCVPIAVVFMAITIIGIPLALLTLWLYFVLLLAGYVAGCIALADGALHRFRPTKANRLGWRVLTAILAVLVVTVIARIPVLGGIVSLVVLLAGIGAIALQWPLKSAMVQA